MEQRRQGTIDPGKRSSEVGFAGGPLGGPPGGPGGGGGRLAPETIAGAEEEAALAEPEARCLPLERAGADAEADIVVVVVVVAAAAGKK